MRTIPRLLFALSLGGITCAKPAPPAPAPTAAPKPTAASARVVSAEPAVLSALGELEIVDRVAWPGAQEALEGGQVDTARRLGDPLPPDVERLVDGLELVLGARGADARAHFEALAADAEGEGVRALATTVAAQLAYDQADYAALLPLVGDDDSGLIVRALAELPPLTITDGEPGLDALTLSSRGHPFVQVRAGVLEDAWMFDTGAAQTTIAASVAAELGVETVAGGGVGTSTGEERVAEVGVLDRLAVGGVVVHHVPVLVFPDEDLTFEHPDHETLVLRGVIGWPVIRHLHAELDYAGGTYTARRSEAATVDDPNLTWLGYPLVRVASDTGQPLLFGLDTGSSTTSMTESLLTKIGLGPTRTERALIGGVGGFVEQDVTVVEHLDLAIGDTRLGLTDVQTESESGSDDVVFFEVDGVLGSDIAGRGTLVLDPLAGELRVVPAASD